MIDKPMSGVRWHRFENFDQLSAAVNHAVIAIIEEALALRGQAMIALPGGSTPVPIFSEIVKHALDWSRVTVLPTDDRLVTSDDTLSNSAMLTGLFSPRGARVIAFNGLIGDPVAAAERADAAIADLPFPLDLVWTGVGTDGHTASILAGPDIERAFGGPASQRLVGITPDPLPPEAPVSRVTLTSAALLDTRALMIVMTGIAKRTLVEDALSSHASPLPIARLLAASPLAADIYWCP